MGTPQVAWAYESQMDMIAREMGWDPVEFRLKNLLDKGEEFAPGETPLDTDLREGLLRAAKEIGWGEELEPDCGIGVSCACKDGGGNFKISSARVEVDDRGVGHPARGHHRDRPGLQHRPRAHRRAGAGRAAHGDRGRAPGH